MGDAASTELQERELRLAEEKARADRELKQRELALSEAKLQQDRELKEQEFQLQVRQLAIGRWSGPVAVAVIAGLLGIAGTFFSASENRELERKKQEGTLLLEAIRTGANGKEREQQAAANLVFLAEAGLVTLGKEQLGKLRQKAGDATPSLPSATSAPQQVISDSVRQRILKSFDDFAVYFRNIGAKTTPKVPVEAVASDVSGMIAYYDPDKKTAFVDVRYLADINLPLREYAHAVLDADGKRVDYEKSWAYLAIESGLASYFSSSFVNDPRVPGGDATETLENKKSLRNLKSGPMVQEDGLYSWGGAFWELRTSLGQGVIDKLLLRAWQNLRDEDFKKNDPKEFVRSLLKADTQLEGARHQTQIKDLFGRRGISLD